MAKKLALRNKKFDSDTELMRIIAAFFVIVIHCSGTRFMSEVICNAVSRFSVPVFIILSGYYMLVRKPEAKRIFQKSAKIPLYLLRVQRRRKTVDISPTSWINHLSWIF